MYGEGEVKRFQRLPESRKPPQYSNKIRENKFIINQIEREMRAEQPEKWFKHPAITT